jgi:DNA-binding CsgD family transcriptional regulator
MGMGYRAIGRALRVSADVARAAAKWAVDPEGDEPALRRSLEGRVSFVVVAVADDALELYRAGLSFSQIGERLGISHNTARKAITEKLGSGRLRPKPKPLSKKFTKKVFELRDQGDTRKQIAARLGISKSTVDRVLKRRARSRPARRGAASPSTTSEPLSASRGTSPTATRTTPSSTRSGPGSTTTWRSLPWLKG